MHASEQTAIRMMNEGRRKMRKYLPMLGLLLAAACELAHEPEVRNKADELQEIARWTATVSPVGSATISGTATFREFGSYYIAEVTLNGGEAVRAYQWRLYRGSCADETVAQHGPTQAFADLVTDANGTATLTRTLAGALNSPDSIYNIRVRPAITSTNWTTGTDPAACGDLVRS